MIFNCPRCSAGHSVPVSMIPNGGLEMSCRRCNELFHVAIAEKTNAGPLPEKTNSPALAEPDKGEYALAPGEPTRVGVANPLDERGPPLLAPDGSAFAADGTPLGEEPTDDSDHVSESDRGSVGLQEDTEDEDDVLLERPPDPERTRQGRLDPDPAREGFEIDFSERLHAKTKRSLTPVTSMMPVVEDGAEADRDPTMRMNTPSKVSAIAEPSVASLPEVSKKATSPKPPSESLRTPSMRSSSDSIKAMAAKLTDAQKKLPPTLPEVPRKLPATATGPIEVPSPPADVPQSSGPISVSALEAGLISGTGTVAGSGAAHPASAERTDHAQANVYDRVEKGLRISDNRAHAAAERARPRHSNEPAASREPASLFGKAVAPAKRLAMLLNRSPLPVKVALVVFPAALGIILVLTSGRNPWAAEPVQIEVAPPRAESSALAVKPTDAPPEPKAPPSQADPEPAARAVAAVSERVEPAAETAQARSPAAVAAKRAGDELAIEGHAYVQVDHARLRAHAGAESALTAKLELGQLVRVFHRTGDWSLVMALPNGPAGFISDRLLAARKPIAILAKEIEFENCGVDEEGTLDDCLYEGKQQQDACISGCGVVTSADKSTTGPEASPVIRCVEACRIAFADCQRSCRGELTGKRRSPKHRASK
jgi:zinc ribbon protein